MTKADCLTGSQILRFVAKQGQPEERHNVERHAADCGACRNELAVAFDGQRTSAGAEVPADIRRRVDALVAPRPNSRASWLRPSWAPAAASLAAATVLVAVYMATLWFDPQPAATLPSLRGQSAVAFELLAPADGVIINSRDESVDFAWQAGGDSAEYHLVILDDAGDRIYQAEAAGGSWRLATANLAPGDYYWTVKRLNADGSSVTTSRRRLRLTE